MPLGGPGAAWPQDRVWCLPSRGRSKNVWFIKRERLAQAPHSGNPRNLDPTVSRHFRPTDIEVLASPLPCGRPQLDEATLTPGILGPFYMVSLEAGGALLQFQGVAIEFPLRAAAFLSVLPFFPGFLRAGVPSVPLARLAPGAAVLLVRVLIDVCQHIQLGLRQRGLGPQIPDVALRA